MCLLSGMCSGKNSVVAGSAAIIALVGGILANDGDHKKDDQPVAAVSLQQDGGLMQEGRVLLQDSKDAAQDAMDGAQDELDPDAMMEAWMKAGTPGEHHKLLDDIVGNFTAEMTMVNGPDMPEETMTGKCVNTWVLDGRYVQTEFYGAWGDMPFKGLGFTAYSNADNEVQSIWMDSFSTLMEMATGTMDIDNRTMHLTAKTTDPAIGMKVDVDEVFTIHSRDTHTFVRRSLMPDGTEMHKMTIVYTRTD